MKKTIRLLAVISVLFVGAFVGWKLWFNGELQHPDIPALTMTLSQQKVYPSLEGMVSFTLYFENKVTDVQEFADRVYGQKGVTKIIQLGDNSKVFQIRFDPGYTSKVQVIGDVITAVDDPKLFIK